MTGVGTQKPPRPDFSGRRRVMNGVFTHASIRGCDHSPF